MELVGLGCNWWEGTYPSPFFLLNSNVGHEMMARTKSAEHWICNVIKTGVSFKLEALTGLGGKKRTWHGETKKGLGNRKRNRRWSSENESIRAEAAADWFTEGVKKRKEELGAFEPGRVAACHEG